jgi:acetyl esterase
MSGTATSKPVLDPPVLDPVVQKLLDEIAAAGYPPIYTLSPADARNALTGFQAQPANLPPTTVEDEVLSVGPTGTVPIRIVRPEVVTGPLPVVMYFHGGGWMLGDRETHDRLIRDIAHGAQAAVVFVDYDRTPEAQFPIANEQAYAATKFVAENGATWGLDGGRLAVAGDSAGGNMAAVVALMAKERGGPKIDLQVMFYPVTDAAMNTPSYAAFGEGYWLLAKAMTWFCSGRVCPQADPCVAPQCHARPTSRPAASGDPYQRERRAPR